MTVMSAPSRFTWATPASLTPSRRAAGAPADRSATTTRLPLATEAASATTALAAVAVSSTGTTARLTGARSTNRDDLPQVIDHPVQSRRRADLPDRAGTRPARSRPTLSRTGAPMAYAMSSLRRSLSDVIAAITTMPMPRARPMRSPAAAYFTMPFVRETFTGSAASSTTLPLIMSCMFVLAVASAGVTYACTAPRLFIAAVFSASVLAALTCC